MPAAGHSLYVKTLSVLDCTSELFIKFVIRLIWRKIKTIETRRGRDKETGE